MDTNKSYCERLSQVLCGLVDDDITQPFDVREEILKMYPGMRPLPAITPEGLFVYLQENPSGQAKLAVISEYTPSKWLLERELESQRWWRPGDDAYTRAADRSAIGLCLSGGGIRSATFNLGILQGLSEHRRLGNFTYLSSVSGGGYIHQFLAAWIYNRKLSPKAVSEDIFQSVDKPVIPSALDDIQDFLRPIPNTASDPNHPEPKPFRRSTYATVTSEPLRWLRRYTNYLAPRKDLIGLDTWTIIAVWLRNTILNFIVVLSAFVFLLLLPHLPITRWIIGRNARPSPHHVVDTLVAAGAILGLTLAGARFRLWLRDCGHPAEANPVYTRIMGWILLLFVTAVIVSPAVYRSSIPCEYTYFYSQPSLNQDKAFLPCLDSNATPKHWPVLNPVFAEPTNPSSHLHYTAHFEDTSSPSASTLKIDADTHTPEPVSRLRSHWDLRPASFLPHPLHLHSFLPSEFPTWFTRQTSFPLTRIAFVLGNACLLLLLGLAAERLSLAGRLALFLLGIAFAWLLLFGVRMLFFVAAFAPRPELISSLGVVILPPLLFGIPFITLELGVGLIGDRMRDEHREWIARLRAASFLIGAAWLLLTGFSLFGPEIFDKIAAMTYTRYAVWSGWLLTTVGGILAARSSRTNGKAADSDETEAKGIPWLEILATFAPPVFIAGLLILIAKLTSWSIIPTTYLEPAPFHIVCISGAAFLGIFYVFGRRIDINDFSMHPFYRDRLARCYAGASNPDRRPNRFTGFDPHDRELSMASLLPTTWHTLDGMDRPSIPANTTNPATSTPYTPAPPTPMPTTEGGYAGPFPIICTSINLTTGEDLAYQERKAASFTFTPLFSGFNVGWTAGKSKSVQFNGFVPTSEYVYTDQGGISLATAVAISGAAASPNMGYHTSPAIAFLMTVFNVRLGWWLRNSRRRTMYAVNTKTLPSAPRFGPLRLFDELAGRANDTASYIYLTDGGHFDNMGLYELLRRRCRTVVVCDGEADGRLAFEGIAMAIRKARLDFGIEVTLDGLDPTLKAEPLSTPEPDPTPTLNITAEISPTNATGITGQISGTPTSPNHPHGLNSFKDYPSNTTHAVFGTIVYPEDPANPGHILYIKSSLTGDEPADVLNFRRQHPTFPNDTTLNQFFTESQFESYRRLGQHIIQEDTTVTTWLAAHVPAHGTPKPHPATP